MLSESNCHPGMSEVIFQEQGQNKDILKFFFFKEFMANRLSLKE